MNTATDAKSWTPALVLLLVFCLFVPLTAAAETVTRNLSPRAFKAAIDRHQGDPDVILLDIRTPAEFAAGHIRGATLIDYYSRDYVDRLKALDRQKTYLVYCRSGNRTGRSLAVFKRLGFSRVYQLENGLIGWIGEKFPLVREAAS